MRTMVCGILMALATLQPYAAELKWTEIRTASSDILVAYFKGEDIEAVDMNIGKWSLNEATPLTLSTGNGVGEG